MNKSSMRFAEYEARKSQELSAYEEKIRKQVRNAEKLHAGSFNLDKSDFENRLHIWNEQGDGIGNVPRYRSDPVYQALFKAYPKLDFDYRYAAGCLMSAIEERIMNEQQYTSFEGLDHEQIAEKLSREFKEEYKAEIKRLGLGWFSDKTFARINAGHNLNDRYLGGRQ